MSTRGWLLMAVLALAVLGGLDHVPAAAETVNCTTVAPPATIGSPGVYCLKQNATVSMTTGQAIVIDANNVVLDLNGWVLRNNAGTGADVSATVGIVMGGRRTTIRNGTIQGFGNGVSLTLVSGAAPTGHVVEDLHVVNSKRVGINLPFGTGHVIQRNLVLNTGDETATLSTNIFAISAGFATVQNNDIVTVIRGEAVAAGLMAGASVVLNNRIRDVDGFGVHCQIGARLRDNIVLEVTQAAYGPDCDLLGNNFP